MSKLIIPWTLRRNPVVLEIVLVTFMIIHILCSYSTKTFRVWARIINSARVRVESLCLCNNYLTLKLSFEPLHNPCLFNRVSLASTFVLRLLSKPSCRWAGSGVRPLLPRWSKCGGVGRCGCKDVLEQGIIILVCLYRNRSPREHVNAINFKFLFNMTFVSPRLVSEAWNPPILNL